MDTSETTRGNDPRGQDGIGYDQSADNPSDSTVVADGGTAPCPGCDTDLLVQQSVKDDKDWWCHGCDRHFSSDDPPGGVTFRTDGGEALSESLKTALENADCHPDMVRYAEKAAERDRTPILNSLRRFHDVSDVSRIETVGTQIERSLWKDGAEATLRRHGHVDEMNAEILQEIVEQQPVTDGNHPSGHSPGAPTSDRSSAAEYFVVDEARPAVVDGPLPMARAKVLANEHGPDHIVAERSAIQLLESASNTTVRWETDDVDVVTDGGRRLARRDVVDAVQADAGVGDQGPGGCPHSDDELPCWDCLTDGEGGSQ